MPIRTTHCQEWRTFADAVMTFAAALMVAITDSRAGVVVVIDPDRTTAPASVSSAGWVVGSKRASGRNTYALVAAP